MQTQTDQRAQERSAAETAKGALSRRILNCIELFAECCDIKIYALSLRHKDNRPDNH